MAQLLLYLIDDNRSALLITKQYDRKEYVKPSMFFVRCLAEEKKKKPVSSNSSTYKHQWDELTHLSKLYSLPSLEKKEEKKGKEKFEPSARCEKKMRLVLTKILNPLLR